MNRTKGFDGFIAVDPLRAHDELVRLRERASSFVELGCGSGLVTILADLLGYDACGIESRPELIDAAEELAERHGAAPRFVLGSFLPSDADLGELLDADFHLTDDSTPSAWTEVRLADFDIVYAFPWPGEEDVFHELMRRHGRAGHTLLVFNASEGFVEHAQ